MAGNYIKGDVVTVVIQLVSETSQLHAYSVQQLFRYLSNDISQQPLAQVAAWCIGEYGELLHSSKIEEEEPLQVSNDEVISLLERILINNNSSVVTKEYAITALMKLSSRFTDCSLRLQQVIAQYGSSTNVELQQRSVEYSSLFVKFDNMRPALLEHMPLIEAHPHSLEENFLDGQEEVNLLADSTSSHTNGHGGTPIPQPVENGDILDILSSSTSTAANPASNSGGGAADLLDLLGDLTMDTSSAINNPVLPPGQNLLDGFVQPAASQNLVNGSNSLSPMAVFNKAGLLVEFTCQRASNDPTRTVINMKATNSSPYPMSDFVFQAAVPKSFQLNLQSPSGTSIPPVNGGPITQVIQLNNPQKQPIRMRLKINYTHNGNVVNEMAEVNTFPSDLWQ
ncbi:hypothetical protein EGW08_020102 [Elysia chlorotica]|uniref:GAE domain-containing protein n=1 Tax=Elysia chlorotica TaxID=188477 RepID=A0A433SS91_ELYCH|nr:hypothetical protein EGW08_020102 [Elysia chlorotica]